MKLVFAFLFVAPLVCGNQDISSEYKQRVIGGVEVTPNEYKHLVLIRKDNSAYCAGSIIHPEWVVTAAQCMDNSPFRYTVTAGEHNMNMLEGREQMRDVNRILFHPRWGSESFEGDIAVLHVTVPFEFNEYVQAIDIVDSEFTPTNTAVVVGWGSVTEHGPLSPTPRKVAVPYVLPSVCEFSYPGFYFADSMFCYGESGRDACTGDSGAPLMCDGKLCGLASWGIGCGLPGFPGVYTEMAYFSNWVTTRINPRQEDEFPELTYLNCGGPITATSARISVQMPIEGHQRCTWLVNMGFLGEVRVVLRAMLDFGTTLHVTEYNALSNTLGDTRAIVLPNQNVSVAGPIFLLTLFDEETAGQLVTIEMFGSGYMETVSLTRMQSLNSLVGTGTFRHPPLPGNYNNTENALFLVSPEQSQNVTLDFIHMDIEGTYPSCSKDALDVFAWNGTRFNLHDRLCGSNLPNPVSNDDGDFLLLFHSDEDGVGNGFSFMY